MDHALARRPDPLRRPALACGSLALAGILIAALAPKADLALPHGAEAQQVALRFDDAPGGTVIVREAGTGAEIARLGFGEGGFVRATMRGFAAERIRRGLSDRTPFELARFDDGSIVISDPEVGRSTTLNAFGRGNADAFAAFLDHGRDPQ